MKRAFAFLPVLTAAALLFSAACKDEKKEESSKHVAPDPSAWIRDLGGQNPAIESAPVKVEVDAEAPLPIASGSAAPPASASAAPVASASGSAAPKPPKGPTQTVGDITVVEKGAEPRTKLRYKWKTGQKETLVMETKRKMTIESGGKQGDQPTPMTRLTITAEGKSVAPDGSLTYAFTLDSVELVGEQGIPPQALAVVRKELDTLKGTTGQGVVTARGLVKDAGFTVAQKPRSEIAAQLVEQARIAVRDLAPPLPDEEVGKGAKWERTSTLEGRVKATTKETYTLKEALGDQLTLEVVMVQSAPPQAFPGGGPEGANVRIESLSGRATGTTLVDLNKLVPKSELHGVTTTALVMDAEGQTQRVKMIEKNDSKAEPKK